MTETYYSTPEEVIQYTGVRPQDFYLEDDDPEAPNPSTAEEKLTSLIANWLVQIKDFIDRDRNRDYSASGKVVPPGIHNIALRAAANMVAQAQLRRETPIVKKDDFTISMVEDKVFTASIKSDLSRFPFRPNFKLYSTATRRSNE